MTDTYDPEESAERPLSAEVARHAEDEVADPKPEDIYVGDMHLDEVADGGDNGIDINRARIVFQGEAISGGFAKGGVIRGPVSDGDDSIPVFLNRDHFQEADEVRRKGVRSERQEEPRGWEEYLPDEDPASVYVAGPMRGKVDHNYPVFHAVTENLRRQGFIVKNPAENFDGDQSHELSEYMELDLQMVMDTEGIVLLPGWRDSELGRIEAAMAKALEHKFYKATLVDETDASYGVDPFEPDSWIITEIPTPTSTDNRGIDGEARSLVYGARNALYGSPVLDFTIVGRKWAATLSGHLQEHVEDIPPTIVAVMLTDLKTSRQARTPGHHDSRVDVIGYQLCLDRIVTNDGATPDD